VLSSARRRCRRKSTELAPIGRSMRQLSAMMRRMQIQEIEVSDCGPIPYLERGGTVLTKCSPERSFNLFRDHMMFHTIPRSRGLTVVVQAAVRTCRIFQRLLRRGTTPDVAISMPARWPTLFRVRLEALLSSERRVALSCCFSFLLNRVDENLGKQFALFRCHCSPSNVSTDENTLNFTDHLVFL